MICSGYSILRNSNCRCPGLVINICPRQRFLSGNTNLHFRCIQSYPVLASGIFICQRYTFPGKALCPVCLKRHIRLVIRSPVNGSEINLVRALCIAIILKHHRKILSGYYIIVPFSVFRKPHNTVAIFLNIKIILIWRCGSNPV